MSPSTALDELPKPRGNLRNFDLTVDEIKVVKTIENMTRMLESIEKLEPDSPRVRIIRSNIHRLQERLDELQENTLIR